MPTLRLAANFIDITEAGLLVPERIENSGHLQFVFDGTGPLLEDEVQSLIAGFGDWQYEPFGQLHGENTAHIDHNDVILDPNRYASIELSLRPEQTAEHVWELIGQIKASFREHGVDINYDELQNSNSYVTTVLNVLGIPLTQGLIDFFQQGDIDRFPGAFVDVLQNGALETAGSGQLTPITLEVVGTEGNDYINSGIGDDILGGAGGDDTIFGGGGNDLITGGSSGINILDGGENADDNDDIDELTFAKYEGGVRITLDQSGAPGVPASFLARDTNDPALWEDQFVNFEFPQLTRFDDIVEFNEQFFSMDENNTGGIDAGGSLEQGDLLDMSEAGASIIVDLQGDNGELGSITMGEETLLIDNFDNVTGTDHVDNITGSDGRNSIYGGAEGATINSSVVPSRACSLAVRYVSIAMLAAGAALVDISGATAQISFLPEASDADRQVCERLAEALHTLPANEFLCEDDGADADGLRIDWFKVVDALPFGERPVWVELDATTQDGREQIMFMHLKLYANVAPMGDWAPSWDHFFNDATIFGLGKHYLSTGEIDPRWVSRWEELKFPERARGWRGTIRIGDAEVPTLRIAYPDSRGCPANYAGYVFVDADPSQEEFGFNYNYVGGFNIFVEDGQVITAAEDRGNMATDTLDPQRLLQLSSDSVSGRYLCSLSPKNLTE